MYEGMKLTSGNFKWHYGAINDEMYELYKDKGITKIVGIESRGFVMSSALAIRLGAGVVLCRKPGKLPCETVQES
jgi:adenine phosphoribosyltransferase